MVVIGLNHSGSLKPIFQPGRVHSITSRGRWSDRREWRSGEGLACRERKQSSCQSELDLRSHDFKGLSLIQKTEPFDFRTHRPNFGTSSPILPILPPFSNASSEFRNFVSHSSPILLPFSIPKNFLSPLKRILDDLGNLGVINPAANSFRIA